MPTGGLGVYMAQALDVEIRVEAAAGLDPIWVNSPSEARNWITDAVHSLFRSLVSGQVQPDPGRMERVEGGSYTLFLTVFCTPSAYNKDVLNRELSQHEQRLADDLRAKFGSDHGNISVRMARVPDFMSLPDPGAAQAGAGGGGLSVIPNVWNPPAPPPPPSYGYSSPGGATNSSGGPSEASAIAQKQRLLTTAQTMMLIGLVSALFISTVGLLVWGMNVAGDLSRKDSEHTTALNAKDEQIESLTQQNLRHRSELARLSNQFQLQDQSQEELDELWNEVSDVYANRGGPAPQRPALPSFDKVWADAINEYKRDLEDLRDEIRRRPQRPIPADVELRPEPPTFPGVVRRD